MKTNKGLPCRMTKVKTPRQTYLAKRRNDKIIVILLRIGVLAFFIGLWELAAELGWIDPFITSCPSRIAKTLSEIDMADLFTHIAYTLIECIIGFFRRKRTGYTDCGTAVAVYAVAACARTVYSRS